jgi:hypothetical protein
VSDLASLPRNRAIVFASGTRPMLIETTPWQTGPHAAEINAAASVGPRSAHLVCQ